ncbi:MAG TPA: hypothetical protein VFY70_10680 [Thermomicrobiales bacterium]|nr:hypothetical protein [Thermomicrobiales bacterium]
MDRDVHRYAGQQPLALPQQNLCYQTTYFATGERSFSHEQARPLAFAYPAFVLVALVASIPYWRWLSLIT